jgi:hypothetical protein
MQIKNILSRISDMTRVGLNREPSESAARRAIETPAAARVAESAAQAKLREILAGHDVTNITPKAFSGLLQELQQASILPDRDLNELFQIRADLDQEGIAPDQRVNLLEMYARRVKQAERDAAELQERLGATSAQALMDSLRRRLSWLEKFATIHAAPDGAAVNTLA